MGDATIKRGESEYALPQRPVRVWNWPKCDFCGSVMERDEATSGRGVFGAKCPQGCMAMTFASCRYGHQECAKEQLHPWRDWPREHKTPSEYRPNVWRDKVGRQTVANG